MVWAQVGREMEKSLQIRHGHQKWPTDDPDHATRLKGLYSYVGYNFRPMMDYTDADVQFL